MSTIDKLQIMNCGEGFDLLSGIKILDLTTSIAGPYATMMLADMGAEVIKVERPGAGDDTRQWLPPENNGESLWFQSVNRNKQSITLSYDKPEGYELLCRLVKQCAVIVVNQLPRVQKKLSIDFESISEVNPNIIFVSLTGFGLEGERAEYACYDLIAEGYSGIMDLTGERESPPQKVGTPAADMLAGMDAAYGAACAIFANSKGEPRARKVDISLVESMTRFLAPRIVPYMGSGEVSRRTGGRDSVIAVYQVFDTQDDPLTLGLGNDAIWRRFWQAVEQPEHAEREVWSSNQDRREHREEIVAMIQQVLLTRPREQWLDILAKARVPAGPINRVDQLVADQELQRRGLFYSIPVEGGSIPQVGTGIHVDGQHNQPRTAPPTLGQHTESVLINELGIDPEQIKKYQQAEII